VRVEGTAEQVGLAEGTAVPDTIALDATPTADDFVLPVDLVMLDILRTNRWRRPLCFSLTVDEAGMSWLRRYRRLDGLHWRIVPVTDPAVDVETLRRNLLETYIYRGYADPAVRIDPVSRNMGLLYQAPFLALIRALRERGAAAGLREATVKYVDALPCARLGPDACSNQPADVVGVP
jgi:hypothetical protein